MPCFIGIDDIDNRESRGTGLRARQLGADLANARLAVARGITRHQLHPELAPRKQLRDRKIDDIVIGELERFRRRGARQRERIGDVQPGNAQP